MSIRILGYVMARDEWPLLALAITHALHAGVDHVVVVDHSSSDGTSAGLQRLSEQWPDRIIVLRLEDEAYLQEATTRVVMEAVGAADFDWVYVFDADEFILPGPDTSLTDVLRSQPADVDEVRYEAQRWVTPVDMDETNPDDYQRIVKRAFPTVPAGRSPMLMAEQIAAGDLNFFDLPSPTKVIVRGHLACEVAAGAHFVHSTSVVGSHVDPEQLRAGHLPLLSRERLMRKSRHGQSLIDAGFSKEHGWQNQLIRRLELAGMLDDLWRAHSDSSDGSSDTRVRPTTVTDVQLTQALKYAVELALDLFDDRRATPSSRPVAQAMISLDSAIRAQDRVRRATEAAIIEHRHLAAQLTHTTAERNDLVIQLAATTNAAEDLAREVDALRGSWAYRVGRIIVRPITRARRTFTHL